MTRLASFASLLTNASRLSFRMRWAAAAATGISIIGFSSGSCMISSARRAILTPLSPMRSISATIFIAVEMKRRSEATGCSRARISKQMLSISSSSLSTSSSSSTTRWASDGRRSTSARVASAIDFSALQPISRSFSFNERSSCSYCLLVCSRSCMTESPTSNQIDISNLLQLHELSVANAGAFDRLHAYVLGAEAYAHDAGGHAAKRRPAPYQFHGPRCGNLFVRTQNTPYQSILNEDLHGLCDPRWQFTAGLDSFEMRNCRAGLCQMRGQNIGCRDRVLNCQIDSHTSDGRHRVGGVPNTQESGAIPFP